MVYKFEVEMAVICERIENLFTTAKINLFICLQFVI